MHILLSPALLLRLLALGHGTAGSGEMARRSATVAAVLACTVRLTIRLHVASAFAAGIITGRGFGHLFPVWIKVRNLARIAVRERRENQNAHGLGESRGSKSNLVPKVVLPTDNPSERDHSQS